jgi:hypothetical protein
LPFSTEALRLSSNWVCCAWRDNLAHPVSGVNDQSFFQILIH